MCFQPANVSRLHSDWSLLGSGSTWSSSWWNNNSKTHRIICRLYLWATSIQHYRQDSDQREITIGVKLNDIPLEIPASAPWLISLLCSQAATLYITSCGRLMGGVGNPKQHLVYHICNGNSDAFKLWIYYWLNTCRLRDAPVRLLHSTNCEDYRDGVPSSSTPAHQSHCVLGHWRDDTVSIFDLDIWHLKYYVQHWCMLTKEVHVALSFYDIEGSEYSEVGQ